MSMVVFNVQAVGKVQGCVAGKRTSSRYTLGSQPACLIPFGVPPIGEATARDRPPEDSACGAFKGFKVSITVHMVVFNDKTLEESHIQQKNAQIADVSFGLGSSLSQPPCAATTWCTTCRIVCTRTALTVLLKCLAVEATTTALALVEGDAVIV